MNSKKEKRITKKEMLLMDMTAGTVRGVLENLRVQLQILDEEIRADQESKAEYEKTLKTLQTRKEDLLFRMDSSNEFLRGSHNNVLDRYNEMTTGIAEIYDKAKKGHAQGIKLLEKEFNYHPVFKRPQDTFTATAFRPS